MQLRALPLFMRWLSLAESDGCSGIRRSGYFGEVLLLRSIGKWLGRYPSVRKRRITSVTP